MEEGQNPAFYFVQLDQLLDQLTSMGEKVPNARKVGVILEALRPDNSLGSFEQKMILTTNWRIMRILYMNSRLPTQGYKTYHR